MACVLLPSGANAPVTYVAAADDPLHALAHKIFSLANRQRRLHGVHPLEWNDTLTQEARRHSINMMERGFFSHTDPVRGALGARMHTGKVFSIRNSLKPAWELQSARTRSISSRRSSFVR